MVYTAEPYIAYRQARQAAEAERALGEAKASKPTTLLNVTFISENNISKHTKIVFSVYEL